MGIIPASLCLYFITSKMGTTACYKFCENCCEIEMKPQHRTQCWKHNACAAAELLQSYQTLHDPVDCSIPGSYVRGILQASQARILEWAAISFSRGSS